MTAPTGRRQRNRLARTDQLMTAATEIVAEHGLAGLTMQSVADRVDCAVGTIYTYFSSKAALLAELQVSAIDTIHETYELSSRVWDAELERQGADEPLSALVRLVAFTHLFVSGDELYPREFELLQELISSAHREEQLDEDQRVLLRAFELISVVGQLIADAAGAGALRPLPPERDRTRELLTRTLRLAGGLNGALLVSNTTGDPARLPADLLDGRALAIALAHDVFAGWGAPPELLSSADRVVEDLAARDLLLRVGHRLGDPAPQS